MGDGTEKAEFGQWSWISPQEIVDRVSFLINPKMVFQYIIFLLQQLNILLFFSAGGGFQEACL